MTHRLTPIVVVGARGRMGTQLLRNVLESDTMTLAGAVVSSGAPGIGQDAGPLVGMPEIGVPVSSTLTPPRGSVVVDFSLPAATESNLDRCLEHRTPLVLGTTGISGATLDKLKEAGKEIAIVSAANFSVGITLMVELARQAARAIGPDWDTELFEIHHRHKRDAPSGTALRIGKAVAQSTSRDFDDVLVTGRASKTEPPHRQRDRRVRAARRRLRRRTHPDVLRHRRTPRAVPPRHGSGHLRPRRPASGPLGHGSRSGALRHEGRPGVLAGPRSPAEVGVRDAGGAPLVMQPAPASPAVAARDDRVTPLVPR